MNTTTLKSNKKNILGILLLATIPLIAGSGYLLEAYAECCGGRTSIITPSTPVVVSNPIIHSANYPTIPTQTFRIEKEIAYQEVEETTYEQVWDTEVREQRYTVSKQVPETSVRYETRKVEVPVWTTEHRDTSYDVIRKVPETTSKEERYTVSRPVTETSEREIRQTVRRPVQETVLQERTYTVNRPVTAYKTEVIDRGQYVNYNRVETGRNYHRLAWQSGGNYIDSGTGTTRYKPAGLYWTPMQGESQLKQESVYQPNFVSQEVPVTTLVPETVVEQVPVTRTTFQEEEIVRREPYQVQRMVQEEVVRQVPVTTYKEVTERVQQSTPVKVCRMETREETREVPVITYKTVTEEKVNQYTVKVPRTQAITKKVLKPYVVEKKIPIDEFGNPITLPSSTTTTSVTTSPIFGSSTNSSPRSTFVGTPAVGGVTGNIGNSVYGSDSASNNTSTDPASKPPQLPSETKVNKPTTNAPVDLGS